MQIQPYAQLSSSVAGVQPQQRWSTPLNARSLLASICAVCLLVQPTVSNADRHSVTKTLSLPGTNSHGANYFNGEVITRYDNAAPYLTEEALEFWQDFFVIEVGAPDSATDATDGPSSRRTPLALR